MPDEDAPNPGIAPGTVFAFFNEIGIIQQLSRAMFEARLPDGIIVQHFSVLNHLIRVADGRTPLELSRAFQVPKASLTNTLAGLEKRGLVEMRPHPKDGRSKQVWLTEEGRAFRDHAISLLVPDILALSDKLDLEELMRLTPRLTEIRKILDENRNT
ncbi:MAG: MarR family transcriptional regulator [Pseudomonadota bacterium]